MIFVVIGQILKESATKALYYPTHLLSRHFNKKINAIYRMKLVLL